MWLMIFVVKNALRKQTMNRVYVLHLKLICCLTLFNMERPLFLHELLQILLHAGKKLLSNMLWNPFFQRSIDGLSELCLWEVDSILGTRLSKKLQIDW